MTTLRHAGMLAMCLAVLAGGSASQAASAGRPPKSAPDRPNILFLLSDDQRADTLHALGNPRIRTPNLDGLARRGTAFLHAYCMGSARHGAVCVPSRAMMLSGRTLFRAPEDLQGVVTWPRLLGRAGYRTFITGKWHNGAASLPASFDAGEAIFLGGMTDQNRVPVRDLGPEGRLGPERIAERFSAELFADAAIGFLRRLPEDGRPFCLYVAFTVPHDPRTPPASYRRLYREAGLPLPRNFLPAHPFDNGEMTVRDERLAPWPRPPDLIRRELAAYYAMISAMDAQVGRILRALEESGREKRTAVVFASDQGLALGSHGLMGKQNLYEPSTRAPLVLAGPGIPRGARCQAFCYLLDLYPTLCELAGVDAPGTVEGRSLLSCLRPGDGPQRDSIFTAYRHLQRAVRDERWKLIAYPQLNRSQLFDLRRDPDETRDLAADPRHAATLNRLRARLESWQQSLGDSLPLSTNRPLDPAFAPPAR